MVQRLKTGKEVLLRLLTVVYMVAIFPLLLLAGLVMFFSVTTEGSMGRVAGDVQGTVLIWAVIFVSIGKFIYGTVSRRRLLKRIVSTLKDPAYFNPDEGYFGFYEAAGKYLGIDTKNGTILYVHRIRKGQVDVIAMTMDDWTNREVEGSLFRIYTKQPELPRIEVGTPWAQRWYDALGAMEHKQFSTAASFKQHVRGRLDELEREHSVQIPRLA